MKTRGFAMDNIVWNEWTKKFYYGWIRRDPRQGPRRKKYNDGSPANYWRDIIFQDPCSYCFKNISTTADHIEPKFNKNQNKQWDTVVGACSSCNRKKGTKAALLFFYRLYKR